MSTPLLVSEALTLSEACHILQVSEATLRRWDAVGKLRAERTGSGLRLFSRTAVEQLARQRQSASRPLAVAE